MSLGRCVEVELSMSFSLPILHHQEHTYFLGVFALGPSHGMGRPTLPFGLVAERSIDNLYVGP